MEQGLTRTFLKKHHYLTCVLLCIYVQSSIPNTDKCSSARDSHEMADKRIIHKSGDFPLLLFLFCFPFLSGSENWKYVVWFTSTSRKSWSFLHVAEKVSEVPNSKYHSLFFVLKETRQQELQRDQEKRKRVFPHIKIWSLYSHIISSSLLSL